MFDISADNSFDVQEEYNSRISILDNLEEFSVSPIPSAVLVISEAQSIAMDFSSFVTARGRVDPPQRVGFRPPVRVGFRPDVRKLIRMLEQPDVTAHYLRRLRMRGVEPTPNREPSPAHVGAEPLSHLVLPLGGAFAPSRELVRFWIRGTTETLRAAGKKEQADTLEQEPVNGTLQHEFGQLVTDTLSSFAHQLRAEGRTDFRITVAGRFDLHVQHLICDRIVVVPDETTPFLEKLSAELRGAVRTGTAIRGRWGQIVSDESTDLSFILHPIERIRDPAFTRAVERE